MWGVDPLAETYKAGTMLQVFLNLPSERPGHKAAWDFVPGRHGGSVAQVARDWGEEFNSVEEFRERSASKEEDCFVEGFVLDSEAYGRDHDEFTRLYVQTYYRVTGEAIRRYDPNHMRLGVRHHARSELHGEVALREYENVKKHVEVFSLNTYHDVPTEAVKGYARYVDMPFLIGEYTWGGGCIYDGQTYPPEWENDHEGRLRQEGVRRSADIFTVPQMAGYTWFKWYCGCTGPDRTGYAVITDDGDVIRFNAPMLRKFHGVLEDVHAGAIDPHTL